MYTVKSIVTSTFASLIRMAYFTQYTQEFKTNFKIAYPIMFGQLGQILVALVDNLMVGRLGAAPLAAVSLGNTLIFIALSLGIGFSFAITPLIAEADGENNTEKSSSIFHHGIVLCTINGLVLALLIFLAKPILYHLDQPEEVVRLAIPYMEVVAISLIPLMIFQAFKQFADGLSQTKYPMIATLLANVLNVVFNYFLIYGIWIFPRLEIVGAALGTLIARTFMLVVVVLILYRLEKFKPFLKWPKLSHFQKSEFLKLFRLGLPTAMQMFFEVGLFTAAIFLSGILGTNAQAANQIALNLSSMTFMIAVGLGVTATIRVGNQKGKKDFPNLRRIAFSIFLQIFLIEAVFALGFILLKDILPTFYIDEATVIYLASQLLVVSALFQLSDGIQVTILGALRGLQDVNIPTLITFISYWCIGFPICWYLGKENNMGSQGIWFGLLGGLTASALLLYFRFNYLSRKLIISNK